MKILGIDPGYGTLGWAVIEEQLDAVAFGVVETEKNKPLDERLLTIHQELKDIIRIYQPDSVAIERIFFTKNTKTAMDVAKCVGAVVLTIKMAGLAHREYTPSQVKQSITGYGRANKDQVQNVVLKLFRLTSFPYPDDTADALAVAACHCLCERASGLRG